MTVPSPQEELARLLSGFWHTQALFVAARLALADLLAAGPRTADELAAATHADARSLYRLLRALASVGVFAEDDHGRFALTPLAECLRSDVEGSLRSLALMRGGWQYAAWGELLYSVQTGQPAFDKIHGLPLFEYLAQNPEQGQVFDDAMTGVHNRESEAMLQAYDFSGVGTLCDVGGGNGALLCAVLKRYPGMRGVLFDRPAVIDRVRANLEAAGLGDRCRAAAGDFFDAVPAGADAYLLRHILHDWNEEKAVTILRSCRGAMGGRGRLLVVEGVVPPGNGPSLSKFFDLAMLVLPGGSERTEREYDALFTAGGFRLVGVVPTRTWVSVIEGRPA